MDADASKSFCLGDFLPGLDTDLDEPPLGTSLVPRLGLTILDPCSLFICKLHAANTRPPGEANNDIKHLSILAKVIPPFLRKLRESPLAEYDGILDAQRLLHQIDESTQGRHPFQIPLPPEDIESLRKTLASHINPFSDKMRESIREGMKEPIENCSREIDL